MMRKLFLFILASILMFTSSPQESYDFIITNGFIYDGATNEPQINDLGIIGDKIVKIGPLYDKKIYSENWRSGHIVSPGFIDVYAHVEDIMRSPVGENAIKQGITLVLGVAMEGALLRWKITWIL